MGGSGQLPDLAAIVPPSRAAMESWSGTELWAEGEHRAGDWMETGYGRQPARQLARTGRWPSRFLEIPPPLSQHHGPTKAEG